MEHYENEKTMVAKDVENEEFKWRPFLRQVFIASCSWVIFFCMGLFMGSPTVIIPQMRREANSTDAVSGEMASWLSSTFCYSAIPWVFILPNAARIFGRKKTVIGVSFNTTITFFVFYFSSTPIHLLIVEILIGMTHAGIVTLNIIVISEYTSPKYRGILLTIKSASLLWGVWVANAIGTFSNWKYIPLFGFICTLYSLTVFFWPESPHWLASKKRFDETKKVHRWLKGKGHSAELELENLIKSFSKYDVEQHSFNLKFVTRKEFYMPLFLSLIAVAQYHFSGKFVITIYAVDVMKKIMNSEKTAYKSMLILDGFTVLSTYIGCVFTKVFRRRTVLLTASGIAVIFLYALSLYMFLIKRSLISENIYMSLFLLAGFSSSISSGPIIMSTTLYGELVPVRFKSISIIIIALAFFIIHGTLLKISPLIFSTLSMSGTFLFYGISSTLCAVLMYIYLPETKDKTLLEIEEYFKDVSVEESKKLMKSQS